jgi:hypothetical protein
MNTLDLSLIVLAPAFRRLIIIVADRLLPSPIAVLTLTIASNKRIDDRGAHKAALHARETGLQQVTAV